MLFCAVLLLADNVGITLMIEKVFSWFHVSVTMNGFQMNEDQFVSEVEVSEEYKVEIEERQMIQETPKETCVEAGTAKTECAVFALLHYMLLNY